MAWLLYEQQSSHFCFLGWFIILIIIGISSIGEFIRVIIIYYLLLVFIGSVDLSMRDSIKLGRVQESRLLVLSTEAINIGVIIGQILILILGIGGFIVHEGLN